MALNQTLLQKFVEETSLVRLGQEILTYLEGTKDDFSDSSDSDSSASSSSSEELDEEDEHAFVQRVLRVFSDLLQFPAEISRPYREVGPTADHVNSVTLSNFDSKFPPGYVRSILRFEKNHIVELVQHLKFPEYVLCSGNRIPAFEALVVFLRRLSYPGRYIDIMVELDRLPQVLSYIFNTVALQLFQQFGDKVRSLEHSLFTNRQNQETYANAIHAKGCPFENCTHFGDGTCIQICRPSQFQERFYCGHHCFHCFKALFIQLPNGIAFAFGPFSGSGHDSSAAQFIELDQYLRSRLTYVDKQYLGMYDMGFAGSDVMITPGRRARARTDPEMAAFNLDFSRIRISNEQGIGKVKTLFAFLTFPKNMKALLSPVAVYFFDAVLLTNIHSIFYGSQIADYFNLPVPSIEDYLE